ncbi:uncharacterized protein LOC124721676 [Schistocerca piceifrons]|uniref:uncharacterized protein LOC124721676 n=1 Tax=Schistocerca piceifrons TaxID=274613 RepID=UPI001F5E5750|nr:uncharacterized protein LOC124721676 [Schistocerca piceifrons]
MDLGDYGLCPVCLENGVTTKLLFFHLNLSEACLMCPDPKCPYPLVENGVEVIVQTGRENPASDVDFLASCGSASAITPRGPRLLENSENASRDGAATRNADVFDIEGLDLGSLDFEEQELIKMIQSLEVACATADEELMSCRNAGKTQSNQKIQVNGSSAPQYFEAQSFDKLNTPDLGSEQPTIKVVGNNKLPECSGEQDLEKMKQTDISPEQLQPSVNAMESVLLHNNDVENKAALPCGAQSTGKSRQPNVGTAQHSCKLPEEPVSTSCLTEAKDLCSDRITLEELLGNDFEKFLNDLNVGDFQDVISFDQQPEEVLLECLEIRKGDDSEVQDKEVMEKDLSSSLHDLDAVEDESDVADIDDIISDKLNAKYKCDEISPDFDLEHMLHFKCGKKQESSVSDFQAESLSEQSIEQKLETVRRQKELLLSSKPWNKCLYGAPDACKNLNFATCGSHSISQNTQALLCENKSQHPGYTTAEFNGAHVFKNASRTNVSSDSFLSQNLQRRPSEREHKLSRGTDVKDIFRNTLNANYTKAKRIPMARATGSAASRDNGSNSSTKDSRSSATPRMEQKETSAVANLLNLLIKTSCADYNGDKTDELEAVEAQLLSHFKKAPITYCRLNTIKAACKHAASVAAEGKLASRTNTDISAENILQPLQKSEHNQATTSSFNSVKPTRNGKTHGRSTRGQLFAQTQNLFREMDEKRALKSKCYTQGNCSKTRKENKIYPNPFYQEGRENNSGKGSKCSQCGKAKRPPGVLLKNHYPALNSYKFCYSSATENVTNNVPLSSKKSECDQAPSSLTLKTVTPSSSSYKVAKDKSTMTEMDDQIKAFKSGSCSTSKNQKEGETKSPVNLCKVGGKSPLNGKGGKCCQPGKVKSPSDACSAHINKQGFDPNNSTENISNSVSQASRKSETSQVPTTCSVKTSKTLSKSCKATKEKSTMANGKKVPKSDNNIKGTSHDRCEETTDKFHGDVNSLCARHAAVFELNKGCQQGKMKGAVVLQKNSSQIVDNGTNKGSPKKGQKTVVSPKGVNFHKEMKGAPQAISTSDVGISSQGNGKCFITGTETTVGNTGDSKQRTENEVPSVSSQDMCTDSNKGGSVPNKKLNSAGSTKRTSRARRRKTKEESKGQEVTAQ